MPIGACLQSDIVTVIRPQGNRDVFRCGRGAARRCVHPRGLRSAGVAILRASEVPAMARAVVPKSPPKKSRIDATTTISPTPQSPTGTRYHVTPPPISLSHFSFIAAFYWPSGLSIQSQYRNVVVVPDGGEFKGPVNATLKQRDTRKIRTLGGNPQ